MYLLYCDESNLESRTGDFFVYGGLAIASTAALAFSRAIDGIRARARIPREFPLKFNPAPHGVSHQEFLRVKQEVIEAAIAHECKFFASLILHDIARSSQDARRKSINTICFHFDCYLARPNSHGLVLIDRFDDAQIDAHLREKFSVGLKEMPYSREMRLQRIVGYHYSAIGQSHVPSALDVILGSFRFAVNAFTRNDAERLNTASTLLRMLSPLFWRERDDRVSEISLMFSPKVVRALRFRDKYTSVVGFLAEHGIVPAQPITGTRLY